MEPGDPIRYFSDQSVLTLEAGGDSDRPFMTALAGIREVNEGPGPMPSCFPGVAYSFWMIGGNIFRIKQIFPPFPLLLSGGSLNNRYLFEKISFNLIIIDNCQKKGRSLEN